MDQRDLELLDKQMRAINRAPRRDGVIIVTVLMVFLAGMSWAGCSPLLPMSRCAWR